VCVCRGLSFEYSV